MNRIHVCDLPAKHKDLELQYASTPNVTPLVDGHAVARSSDFIIYSVEAEFIDRVVQQYGPCMSTK
jgi:prephenate dehydrogenase (NADP+)